MSKVSLSLFSPFPVLFFQSHSQNHCDLKLRLSWSGLLLKSTFYVWHRCVFCTLPVVPGVVRHPPLPPGDLTGTVHQPGRGQCLEEYVPIIWRYFYFLLFYVANSNISQKKFPHYLIKYVLLLLLDAYQIQSSKDKCLYNCMHEFVLAPL